MPVLRLFASAREAAGLARAELDGATVGEVLTAASTLYGERFVAVLARSRVWVNGEPATDDTPLAGHDVVAVLPPVSGGAGEAAVLERETPPAPEVGPPAEATPSASLPVAAPVSVPVPAPAPPVVVAPPAEPVPAPIPLPVAAPSAEPAPTPTPPVPVPPASTAPAPPAAPPAPAPPSAPAAPAPPSAPVPAAPVPEARADPAPASPSPAAPMAGLGGAPLPSAPDLVPRDPPLLLPPVPSPPPPPRPGEIGGTAISPPPPAAGAGEAAVAIPETETRPESPPAVEEVAKAEEAPPAPPEAKIRRVRAGVSALARYAVVYDVDRPHGRIGLAWAAVTVAAVFGGKVWLAAWLGLTAFVGASQTAAARRALEERPPPWLAAVTAVGPPVAALSSGMHLVGAVLAGLAVAFLVRLFSSDGSLARDVSMALLVGVVTGTAAASVVATRELGINPTFFLLACAAIYDVGAYLIGTGAGAAWEGPAAGMVGIVPVSILASVLLVPPFPAGGPILLGFLAVILVPLGPLVGTALVGDRELDAPGLRRLDSLLLVGPMWAWAATRLLA